MKLDNKICIVTGATKGIGLATIKKFLCEGATAIIDCLPQEEDIAKKVVNELKAQGFENVDYFAADVTKQEQIDDMVKYVVKKYGTIDVLVNNAGINKIAPFLELTEDDYRRVLDTNLIGVFLCCQSVGRVMVENQSGSIINISSIFGQESVSGRAPYTSSKAAVIGLTKILGVEWAPYNVRVNAVAPGYTNTDMGVGEQGEGGYDDECIFKRTPLGRYAQPNEIANMIAFLASDEGSYAAGGIFNIDGGWTAYGGW